MCLWEKEHHGQYGNNGLKEQYLDIWSGILFFLLFAGKTLCLLEQTESIDVSLTQMLSVCFIKGLYLQIIELEK